MMNKQDQEIKDILSQIDIPKPALEKKQQTIELSISAFEEKNSVLEKKVKGFSIAGRLTDKFLSFFKLTGEFIMKRSTIYQSLAACCLLIGFIGYFNFSSNGLDLENLPSPNAFKNESRSAASVAIVKNDQKTDRFYEQVEPVAEAELLIAEETDLMMDAMPISPLASSSGAGPNSRVMSKPKSIFGNGQSLIKERKTVPSQQDLGRDQFEKITTNSVVVTKEKPVSTFSIDVDTTSYAFTRKMLKQGYLPEKNAIRAEELINYFDYDYPLPKNRNQPFAPTVNVFPTPWNKDTLLMHIGIKGFEIKPDQKPKSNLVFLLDVSGSMDAPDKLPLLKQSFRMMIENMHPEDVVSIVVYAGAAGTVLEPTPVSQKGKILNALESLSSGGSTAGGEGIRKAYDLAKANFDKNGVNRIILATDGDFNVGITNKEALKGFIERKRDTGIYLSVLGFGQGNYNDALMQKLAQNGNGNAAYIDSLSEAQKVLVDEANAMLFPIAKDVKIQVEFNPARVAEYRLIGYETRALKREDFNNDKVDAGDIGAGHSVTAIYEITPVGSKSQLVDQLRYQSTEKNIINPEKQEFAFLKMRYTLPDATTSTLIATPVDQQHYVSKIDQTNQDVRFSISVAAFAQLLKGSSFINNYRYEDVIKLASKARGEDSFGYRNEFLQLVRLAKSAHQMKTN